MSKYNRGDNLVIERQPDKTYKVLRSANTLGQFTKDCIHAIVLQQLDDYVYVIRDDSPLYPGDVDINENSAIHITRIKIE